MSTSSTSVFTGSSRFTNDFQQVITRAVAIASLPITQLTNGKAALSDQASAVSSLEIKFSSLETAIQNLGKATGLSSLSTSVSDAATARISLASGASPATYTLEVQSLGAFTNTLSSDSLTRVSDPLTQRLSNGSSFLVTVDGTTTRVTPPENNLSSLVSTLNSAPGLNLQASLVNVGSNDSPDYRLSIQSTKLGAVAIQVNDGTSDLLNTITSGSLASYKLNGLTTAIQTNSRSVTLAPGVTADLTGISAAGATTTVTIARQPTAIGNALSAFVNSFNAAVDELNLHRGKSGGALTGNSLIQDLGNRLRSLGGYSSGTGQLASLGVTFDGKGHLSYDSSAITSATGGKLASFLNFLGGATTGGFLQSATSILSSVDADSGILKTAENSLKAQIDAQQTLIDTNQKRVDLLKTNLQAQLAKADAQVAALEQSYAVLTGIYQAQLYNNQNK